MKLKHVPNERRLQQFTLFFSPLLRHELGKITAASSTVYVLCISRNFICVFRFPGGRWGMVASQALNFWPFRVNIASVVCAFRRWKFAQYGRCLLPPGQTLQWKKVRIKEQHTHGTIRGKLSSSICQTTCVGLNVNGKVKPLRGNRASVTLPAARINIRKDYGMVVRRTIFAGLLVINVIITGSVTVY